MTKAREVEMVLNNKGFERGTRLLLTELFERVQGIETTVAELASFQLSNANMLAQVVDGAGVLRQQVEKLQGNPNGDDDLPGSAHRET